MSEPAIERADADLDAPLPASAGPLLVIDITVMLGTGAQMHLKSYCDSSDPVTVHNELADKLMLVARRQKAIAELSEMEEALETQRETLAKAKATEAEMLPRREAGKADRRKKLKEAEAAYDADRNARQIQWGQRRQGPYKPTAADDSVYKQHLEFISKLEHEIEAAENEEKAAEENFATNCGVVEKKIERMEAQLAEAKALIEGG